MKLKKNKILSLVMFFALFTYQISYLHGMNQEDDGKYTASVSLKTKPFSMGASSDEIIVNTTGFTLKKPKLWMSCTSPMYFTGVAAVIIAGGLYTINNIYSVPIVPSCIPEAVLKSAGL